VNLNVSDDDAAAIALSVSLAQSQSTIMMNTVSGQASGRFVAPYSRVRVGP
jgi:hypothetical protein